MTTGNNHGAARPISRRRFLQASALFAAGAGTMALAPTATATPNKILGTVIDFAAGVPLAQDIRNAGHLGAVRYVSQRRPGTETWMLGKPVTLQETQANATAGLFTASVYQFGKGETADWLQGAAGAVTHAPQAIALHIGAGGPTNRPIYVAIDDNPTHQQYTQLIRPYLQAFQTALHTAGYQMGVYGNYNTIDWAIQDGLGTYFWQHDWGSQGRIHPRVTIHQVAGKTARISGVEVDVNNVYAEDWGQWQPGVTPSVPDPTVAPAIPTPANPLEDALRSIQTLSHSSLSH